MFKVGFAGWGSSSKGGDASSSNINNSKPSTGVSGIKVEPGLNAPVDKPDIASDLLFTSRTFGGLSKFDAPVTSTGVPEDVKKKPSFVADDLVNLTNHVSEPLQKTDVKREAEEKTAEGNPNLQVNSKNGNDKDTKSNDKGTSEGKRKSKGKSKSKRADRVHKKRAKNGKRVKHERGDDLRLGIMRVFRAQQRALPSGTKRKQMTHRVLSILEGVSDDLIHEILSNASDLMQCTIRTTMTTRDLESATNMVLRGDLAKYAALSGTRSMYLLSKGGE